MSNIKEVKINGMLPFNFYENDRICRYVAFMNSPTVGLSMTWNKNDRKVIDGEKERKTILYGFEIKGREAISWEYLSDIISDFEKIGGIIDSAMARDFEDEGNWVDIRYGLMKTNSVRKGIDNLEERC